ncbi:SIS domain-containing protein [Sporolactobacillus terrae]|uniref:Phosphosugar isomerase n=1 Tax=Sporolactobacillus terrae TaxID=269673 RepID=A0A5K7WYU1_9BACL|nr:SIS domain-containing protein [Sporolactobacillus terrae]BBN99831.1 phosphosugar isomerase [Sporolactobacillus terrae]
MNIENYIQETPQKMKEIIAISDQLFSEVKKQKFERIIITGSGTSYHSGAQVQQKLREITGISVEAYYPFELTKEVIGDNQTQTLLIGISQGGSSYSTYNAMKLAKEQGCKVASMAGQDHVLIDEAADYVLTVRCGEETAGAKTKGFYCTMLNLILLGLYLGQENGTLTQAAFNNEINSLKMIANNFQDVYVSAEQWVKEVADGLKDAKEIRVVGTKELYGDTLESALKLLETMRLPTSGYEFEEFIHGIYNAVNENSSIIIYHNGTEPRVDKLISVLSEWTNHIYVIGSKVDGLGARNFVIDDQGNDLYSTFVYPIAVQLICAFVPQLKGIDPSTPKDPQFHSKMGSKKINK